MDNLLIVNEFDKIIGTGEKLELHINGTLHRAFSIFAYTRSNGIMFLIQKRAENKYHSGGKWSNSCCSHPRLETFTPNELNERLEQELNFDPKCNLICNIGENKEQAYVYCGKIRYKAYLNDIYEHEIDHIFILELNDVNSLKIKPNIDEASDLKWVGLNDLINWMEKSPDDFSAWFIPTFIIAYRAIYLEKNNYDDLYMLSPYEIEKILFPKISSNVLIEDKNI